MRKALFFGLLCASIMPGVPAIAQSEIALGTWRVHLSYNSINAVAMSDDKVYGASDNSVIVLEKSDRSVSSYTKLNGLSGAGITAISVDPQTKILLIAYSDGNLDLVAGNEVSNFDRLKNSSIITGSKRINSITVTSGIAYLATDYGVVVFDVTRREVKETWRDLDVGGGMLRIYQSTFLGDSIFLATDRGVMAGNMHDNLLDFSNWKRFNTGIFNTAIHPIVTFQNRIYTAVNSSGIYYRENGSWTQASFLSGKTVTALNASGTDLLAIENSNLWKIDAASGIQPVADPIIVQPITTLEDTSGKLWIGDAKNGLVSNTTGVFSNYLPNGPLNVTSQHLVYHEQSVYDLPGGHSTSFTALGNANGFDVFSSGMWENQTSSMHDITDAAFADGITYLSSFGYGVEIRSEQGIQVFNNTNSPLVNTNSPAKAVNITALETTTEGLWVANYGAVTPLHLLKKDNTWQSFSFPITSARYITDFVMDSNGFAWLVLNPAQGGGLFVFDKTSQKTIYLTDQPGSGGLPSIAVRSIATDRDGYVWIGTDAGVAYVADTYYVFSNTEDVIKPIFENRYLLRSEKITAIAVDGGNRKWMGTERGVWLFNPTGEKLIYNFTADNSPLLSNVIRDIVINDQTGEVFFATDKGIVSFRSDATTSSSSFQSVKIFPNPVTSVFTGLVGINGLATDAIVKITDVSGKLIWQTQANGGTATWNVRDYNGNRAQTGVYLVFAATQDGSESIVGKIAVVD